jgi:membrane protease YdiL (CAAX protease family)
MAIEEPGPDSPPAEADAGLHGGPDPSGHSGSDANRRALHFILAAYGLAWTIALVAWLLGLRYASPAGIPLAAVFMLTPATAVILLERYVYREPLASVGLRWRGVRWGWVLTAIPLSWVVTLGTLAITAFVGNLCGVPGFGHLDFSSAGFIAHLQAFAARSYGMHADVPRLPFPPAVILLLCVAQSSIVGAALNLPFTIGEELGWRGFLLKATRQLGPVLQTLLIGAVWGLWHAPLILQGHNYPGHPWSGILMMMAFTTSISYPMGRLAVRSGSVLAPAVFHGVLNPIGMAAGLFIADSNPLLGSVPGVAGIAAGLLLTAGFALWEARHQAPAGRHPGELGPAG